MTQRITGYSAAALALLMLLGAAATGQAQTPTTATGRLIALPPPRPMGGAEATSSSAGRIPAFVRGAAEVKPATKPEIQPVATGGKITFNFRDVELTTVLDYLSKAAGLIIVRDTSVSGRVDVVSQTPLSREEAVQLLNTVLSTKGYTAILNERTLKIVTITDARQKDLPVIKGNTPEEVKKTDEMRTQIIPIRYVSASQLISALQLLLPTYAVISANDSANSLILTATTTDIRRMMEIITALDTSVAEIASFKVYQLKYADATEVSRMLSDLFRETNQASSSGGGSSRGGFPFPGGPMGMMFGDRGGDRGPGGDRGGSSRGGSSSSGSGDAARRAAQHVTAVADTRTNSLVVSAPKDMLVSIDELVSQIDSMTEEICEIRVFTLRYADATAMSQLVNDVFQSQQGSSSSRGGSSSRSGFSSMIMSRFMGNHGGGGGSNSSGSRSSQETMVLAVPDIRTNAVVVNASKSMMEQIGPMIKELDTDPAKDKKVYVYPLKYADAEQMSTILEDMFSGYGGRGSSSSRNRTSGGVFGQSGNFATNRAASSSRGSSGGGGGSVPSGMNLP